MPKPATVPNVAEGLARSPRGAKVAAAHECPRYQGHRSGPGRHRRAARPKGRARQDTGFVDRCQSEMPVRLSASTQPNLYTNCVLAVGKKANVPALSDCPT